MALWIRKHEVNRISSTEQWWDDSAGFGAVSAALPRAVIGSIGGRVVRGGACGNRWVTLSCRGVFFPGTQWQWCPTRRLRRLAELLTVVLQQLQQAAEGTASILLVLSPDPAGRQWAWLLEKLPEVLMQRVQVHHHDPADKNQSGYVASSEGGERLYLNRQVSEADTIVTVGVVCFDGELGLRHIQCFVSRAVGQRNSAANGFCSGATGRCQSAVASRADR